MKPCNSHFSRSVSLMTSRALDSKLLVALSKWGWHTPDQTSLPSKLLCGVFCPLFGYYYLEGSTVNSSEYGNGSFSRISHVLKYSKISVYFLEFSLFFLDFICA